MTVKRNVFRRRVNVRVISFPYCIIIRVGYTTDHKRN